MRRRRRSKAQTLVAGCRRSPHLVAYWRAGQLFLHDFGRGVVRPVNPLAVEILDLLGRGARPESALAARFAPALLRDLLGSLESVGFVTRGQPRSARPDLEPWLSAWGPAASFFHFSSRDTVWAAGEALEALERRFERQALSRRVPAPFKQSRGTTTRLPPVPLDDSFARLLADRRTWRGFSQRPIALRELSTLLFLTWGAQRWGWSGVRDRVAFKTSPSAGGRHPIEAYVLARRVRGLRPGLYHYAWHRHALRLVRPGATSDQIERYLCDQWWYRPASAVVIMTAVLPRVWWRYPFARAYRSVLFEAGHLCQTFLLAATWLKLAPFCTQALADSRVERDLGIDGVNEIVLYAAGVGTRPADGKWVQWPEHRPGHPYLPPILPGTRALEKRGRRKGRPARRR